MAAPGEWEPSVPSGHLASSSWKRITKKDYGIHESIAGTALQGQEISSRSLEIPSSPASCGLSVRGRKLGPILTPF